jgi:hypothetical protein
MPQTVQEALSKAQLYSDGYTYRLIQLPSNAVTLAASMVAEIKSPFLSLTIDKDEVTLLMADDDYQDYQHRLLNHKVAEQGFRLITLDVELELSLVGFMAHISAALAQAGISILPISAYNRDHLFIPSDSFSLAMDTLQSLQKS